jgi:hypothetical protein
VRDVALVLGAAEVEGEKPQRFLKEDRVREFRGARGFLIPQEILVVAPLLLPLVDRFRRNALRAQVHARHVLGRVDDEEEDERDQVHPDKDRDRVQHAPDDVRQHQAAGRAAMRSRFL